MNGNVIHTMEYYSAIKKRKVLLFMIAWVNLKDMLSKISQSLQMELYDLTHM